MAADRRIIVGALIAAILGFAAGALWQYASTRGAARQHERAEHELVFQRLQATLGAATIEAQRGSYEIARQLASSFFSGLQAEVGRASAEQQPALTGILQQRDAIITALSRGDPQSGSLLAQLFLRYRIATGEPVGPDGVGSGPAQPADTGPAAPQ